MNLEIRKYHPSDITSLYKICLLTSNNGKDIEEFENEPDLLGHLFVGPYVTFEPELCFVLTNNFKPCGYVLGTKNSEKFYLTAEKKWFPLLRQRYKLPEQNDKSRMALIKRVLHKGHKPKDKFENHPAHLHIDILPFAQGKGMGKKLMFEFLNQLKNQKVAGLHLEVGKKNIKAINFYQHIGFTKLKNYEHSIIMGMSLKNIL